MGMDLTAKITYGHLLDHENEKIQEFVEDPEEFWQKLKGFKSKIDEIYDSSGSYRPGKNMNDSEAEYERQREFMKSNPMPFELETIRYYEESRYILSIPGIGMRVDDGEWKEFNPEHALRMLENNTAKLFELRKFCIDHLCIKEPRMAFYFGAAYW